MRTARAFWLVIGTAMGSPVAWAGRRARPLQRHSDPAILFRAGGAELCKPPAWECWWGREHTSAAPLFCSLLLNCFLHPLSLSWVQQVPRTPSTLTTFWLSYMEHILKTDCFWWCSRYCSTEIPKGGHKTLPHYCKCWQTLMNRLRYLPLLGQKLKPHCWHFPGLLTLSARSDFMVPNCAAAKKWRYCKLTQHVLRRGPWTPGFPWLLPQSLLGQTHLSYRDWTPSES